MDRILNYDWLKTVLIGKLFSKRFKTKWKGENRYNENLRLNFF